MGPTATEGGRGPAVPAPITCFLVRAFRTSLPAMATPVVVGAVVAAVWWVHAGAGTVLATLVAVLLFPVGSRLAERAVTALLLGIAAVGFLFVVLPVPVTRTTATAFVLTMPVLSAVASVARTPHARVLQRFPTFGVVDATVLAISVLSAGWALAATYAMSLTDTLTRLYHGWDWVLHTAMFSDVYRYGRLAGLQIDSSSAYLSANPQLHPSLWATGAWAGQSGASTLSGEAIIQAGIVATALTYAGCAAALAWLSAEVVRVILGRGARERLPASAAALTGIAAILGSASAVFFYGHTPFLLGVTALAVGSFLAVRPSRAGRPPTPLRSIVLLAATGLVLVLEWPPLVLGLGAAGLLVAWRVVRGHRRTTVALVVAVAVTAVTSPWWWPRLTGAVTIQALSDATGEVARFSLPLTAVAVAVTLAAGVILVRRHRVGLAVAITGPVVGMLVFCGLLMAHGARWWGDPPSYYVLKTLLGALLVTSPVLIAVIVAGAALAVRSTARPPSVGSRSWSVVAAVAVVGVATMAVLSPPQSIVTGTPGPLSEPPRFVTYVDAIARAYPTTPAVTTQVPFLADFGDERANLWLLLLQRGISDADHDFYRTLPAFYPPQTSDEADSLVPPPADWAAVICAQLRVRPQASFVAMTDHPTEVRRWARGIGRTCDASRVSVLEIPGG